MVAQPLSSTSMSSIRNFMAVSFAEIVCVYFFDRRELAVALVEELRLAR
jgi:hypothetical protein